MTACFELPGFSKDEVQINFQNRKLTVSAETKKSEDHTETGYNGKLSRTLELPEGVQVCQGGSLLNVFDRLLIICTG